MAEIARAGTPAVLLALPLAADRIGGARAGEDIAAGDACYIHADPTADAVARTLRQRQ